MRAALELLRELEYERATLWVLRNNQRAIRFYERAGFAADGCTKIETLPGSIEITEMRYGRNMQ